jgi:RNA polymerase sigma-70 factor (ECF subfamily)
MVPTVGKTFVGLLRIRGTWVGERMSSGRPAQQTDASRVVGVMDRTPTLEQFDGSTIRQLPGGPDGFVASTYDAHHAEVYAFLVRSTRDPSTAEDLLQETFLRLTTEARADRAPDQVRAWLFRVASNLAISRARRQSTAGTWMGRYGQSEHDGMVMDSPESAAIRRERTETLERVLGDLPDDARVALLLAAHGFKGEEIAEAIGRSHGATRSMLLRARLRVRDELLAEDVR